MKQEQYTHEDCKAELKDYVGQILILKPDAMYEEYQNTEYQLWLATHGTGCFSWSEPASDTVHAICLSDKDYGVFSRDDFYGVAKEEILPDWAKESYKEILAERITPEESQDR